MSTEDSTSGSDGSASNSNGPDSNGHSNGPRGGAPKGGGIVARIGGVLSNPANRFVLLFLIYLGALAYFYPKATIRYSGVMDWMAESTAWMEMVFFSLFTDSISQTGKMVVFGGFAVQIIEECTGLYEVLIYTSAVMAFPTTLVKKGIGVGVGAPVLYAVNVLRIAFLMVVGRYYPETFDFMHLYFWQATLILMITSVWLLWIFKVVRYEAPPHPA